MGTTLPVLSKYFVEKPADIGWNVGLLYGVNTVGAVVGSFAAGFVLIPALGITWTLYLAALLNLLICVGMRPLKNRFHPPLCGLSQKFEKLGAKFSVDSRTNMTTTSRNRLLKGPRAAIFEVFNPDFRLRAHLCTYTVAKRRIFSPRVILNAACRNQQSILFLSILVKRALLAPS